MHVKVAVKITISRRLAALGIVACALFSVAAIVALRTVSNVSISSSAITTLGDRKDLYADVVPPPMWPVEAVGNITTAALARVADRPKMIASYRTLVKAFEDRIAYWQQRDAGQAHLAKVIEADRATFDVIDKQVIPALIAGDDAAVHAAINGDLAKA